MTDTNINSTSLLNYIERIERLNEDKANINSDIREVFAQAKSEGYDAKAIREIVRLRKIDKAQREHEDGIIETYRNALNV